MRQSSGASGSCARSLGGGEGEETGRGGGGFRGEAYDIGGVFRVRFCCQSSKMCKDLLADLCAPFFFFFFFFFYISCQSY